MTTIQNPAVPLVKGEARASEVRKDDIKRLDKAKTGRRLAVLLGASALVLTLVNLVAAVYLMNAIGELRSIDHRLEDLAGLEKRLKTSLDTVNTGIQAQVETLDFDMRSGIMELENEVGRLAARLDQVPSTAAIDPPLPDTADLDPTAAALPELSTDATEAPPLEEPQAEVAEPETPVAAIKPKPRKSKPPASKVGSSYQRIESADGKVYYRRVK